MQKATRGKAGLENAQKSALDKLWLQSQKQKARHYKKNQEKYKALSTERYYAGPRFDRLWCKFTQKWDFIID